MDKIECCGLVFLDSFIQMPISSEIRQKNHTLLAVFVLPQNAKAQVTMEDASTVDTMNKEQKQISCQFSQLESESIIARRIT